MREEKILRESRGEKDRERKRKREGGREKEEERKEKVKKIVRKGEQVFIKCGTYTHPPVPPTSCSSSSSFSSPPGKNLHWKMAWSAPPTEIT